MHPRIAKGHRRSSAADSGASGSCFAVFLEAGGKEFGPPFPQAFDVLVANVPEVSIAEDQLATSAALLDCELQHGSSRSAPLGKRVADQVNRVAGVHHMHG